MKFKLGDNIIHKTYGNGIVISVGKIYDTEAGDVRLAYVIKTDDKYTAFEDDLELVIDK